MKILLVGRNCHVGGGCTFRYRASLGLLARGHEVSLAAQGGPMADKFRAAGVKVHTLLPTPFNRFQLKGLLNHGGFDVVHACNPTAGDDVFMASGKRKPHFGYVQSIHGVLPPSVKSAAGNPSLTQSDEILCFDRFALESLQKLPGMEHRTIRHVPRPVEKRSEKVQQQTPPLLTMVSRLSKSKGKTALAAIEAVDTLQSEYPGLSLHIVGDGSLRGEVQRRCTEVNAKYGKTLCEAPGASVDPFPAMTSASGVIGTAYVALEALFHEIPVIASGYEGYGVVTPENLDFAVDCNFGDSWSGDDKVDLHKEITTELMLDGFRTVLSRAGIPEGRAASAEIRRRLEMNHSLDQVAQRLEAVYALAIAAKERRNS
jgi:glycosyltransferase involved in cell wall biosynthesis